MGIVNDSTRGTLVAYDGSSDVKECTLSISKKGLGLLWNLRKSILCI